MRAWNRRWIALGVGAGALLAGAAVAIAIVPRTDHAEPELDEDLLRAVAPVVHADLPANGKVTWPRSPAGRWFCAERAIETRRDGNDVRVGLIAACSEYVARDGVLVLRSGRNGALVVTLSPGPDGYRVRDTEVPVDGAGHDASLQRMFSTAGYEKVHRLRSQAGPDPAPEARAAFGLPADAPVVFN